jgi:hypothetical protein
MRDIWIITMEDNYDIMYEVHVATNDKCKVGNYIRNNLDELKTMFDVFENSGSKECGLVGKKFKYMIKENKNFKLYGNDDDTAFFIYKMTEALDDMSDEEIVDEFYADNLYTDFDKVYIKHIKTNDMIIL